MNRNHLDIKRVQFQHFLDAWSQSTCRRLARRASLVVLTLLTFLGITLQSVVSAYSPATVSVGISLNNSASLIALSSSVEKSFYDVLSNGQQQYEAGKITSALQSWQQAAAELVDQPLNRAIALSYISIAAQDLGNWAQAETAISQALALLTENDADTEANKVHAQLLNVQGRLQLKQGKPEMAWETWTQAETVYAALDDTLGKIGTQINQSQALQTMGLYRRARVQLEAVTDTLQSQPDSAIKAIALKSLGTVFQTAGSLEQSQQQLEESLKIYRQIGSNAEVADALFALANTLRLRKENSHAEEYYQEVEALSTTDSILGTQAKLNRLTLLLDTESWQSARKLVPDIVERLERLPASRQAIYARVHLAESLLSHGGKDVRPMDWLSTSKLASLLGEGSRQAAELQDNRAQAFSLGTLSKLYGYNKQWPDSQKLAQRALAFSQTDNAQDMSYRWQQQLGKAYHQQGKEVQAIESYTAAVSTLSEVRRDLIATNADIQYSFRETVEPVYRELVSLLLLPEDASQEAISQSRNVIEELQLAEMENYFRSACIDSETELIDKLDNEAAVMYPIVLSDRVEVVLSLPGLPLQHYRTWQTEAETNQTINSLYRYFNPALSSNRRLNLSKQIYDWLITPAEEALLENNIKTLVFVLDGRFRRIPMAALYDGEHYLLEKYSVALTPGLKLLGPHFQNPKPLQALMLGLTEARDGFSALPGVKTEIEQVASRINAEVIFDRAFTKENLATQVDRLPFPVLHLATHGQFSSDLEKTFLLAWDQRISVGDLDGLLRARKEQEEPIELMVLSACQTAEGDDRAALGLAGMAIRSGARSTLATLWAVNDSSTASLMTEFYKEISEGELTKAEALRHAQIKILRNPAYSHPYYWSPFVLIGNWLS